MPTATNDGVDLYYETAGDDAADETVVFVNTAGYGAWLWSWQYRRVAGPRTVLVYDHRGTGRSDAPPGPYDVDTLVADLAAVLSAHGARRVDLVGVGLGGAIALRYAREHGRARTLTLFGTAPSGEAIDGAALAALFTPVDTNEDADADDRACHESLSGALSPSFREASPETVERICAWRRDEDADRAAFEAQAAAWRAFESEPLYELTLPALVFHGVDDPVVPSAAGETLAEELPRGTFVPVEGRHLGFIEQSRAVTDRLLDFLDERATG
jgi:3-oxoadipate enol-lactonase